MTSVWALAALWLGLALIASLISIWLRISTALSEIVVGTIAQLLIGAEYRAAHQAIEVGIVGDQAVEAVEIGLDGVDRLVVERQLEQGIGIPPCHAGNDRVFASHLTLVFVTSFTGRAPSRNGGANDWNPRGNSDL